MMTSLKPYLFLIVLSCGSAERESPRATASRLPAQAGAEDFDSAPAAPEPLPDVPILLKSIGDSFARVNPRLADFSILEHRAYAGAGSGSLVLARAIRADGQFKGDFTDELFGVFRTLPGDSGVMAVVATWPTGSWRDQAYRFEVIDTDSIVLVAMTMYQSGTQVLRWKAPDVVRYRRPEDSWLGVPITFVDPRAMNFFHEPDGLEKQVDLYYGDRRDFGMRVLAVKGDWFKVEIWVPELPGCENDLDGPVRTDTLWTPFVISGRRMVQRGGGMIC